MYFNIVICFIYIYTHERLDYALKTVFWLLMMKSRNFNQRKTRKWEQIKNTFEYIYNLRYKKHCY